MQSGKAIAYPCSNATLVKIDIAARDHSNNWMIIHR